MSDTMEADVVVVGGGVGGVCAALASARRGAKTLLVERAPVLGGTGVHSPVGLVCRFYDHEGRPVNTGIHRELFPEAYAWSGGFGDRDLVPVYDEAVLKERYRALCAAQENLTVVTDAEVVAVHREGPRIQHLELRDGRTICGAYFVDSTADGNLSALAGASFQKGREGDGALMTATLTFRVQGLDRTKLERPDFWTWGGIRSLRAELDPYYHTAKASGLTDNLRQGVLCFPTPDREGLLFNSTAVKGVDPTVPGSVESGRTRALRQAEVLYEAVREHPALAQSELAFMSPWLGIRESRRVEGDYVLTGADVLGEARFPDMVAASAYEVDIHDPDGGSTRMVNIPGSGYYHIPWRSLVAKGLDNLALGSRCISGDVTAHSSYRVMSGVSAIGEAAGTGAALAVQHRPSPLRDLDADAIKRQLELHGQFVD